MYDVIALIAELHAHGTDVAVEPEGWVSYSGSFEALPPSLQDELDEHWRDIDALLGIAPTGEVNA